MQLLICDCPVYHPELVRLQTKRTWANTQSKLLKATLRREFTLIQRTFFIYIFRSTQVPVGCNTLSADRVFCFGPCSHQHPSVCDAASAVDLKRATSLSG